jgi:hypothetical protein
MRPPLELFMLNDLWIELIYSFVIIICSLMIYRATKEMYELSSYKGIKYFRQAFLFFAIAYFFRYFIQLLLMLFNIKEVFEMSPPFVGMISLSVFLFFSSMAIFYLLYSVMWKKWDHNKFRTYLFVFFALIISFIGIFFRGPVTYLFLNLVLLAFVLYVLLIARRESKQAKKRGSGLYIIYLIFSIFWILNIIDILIPKFLQLFKLSIYLVSIFLFLLILYKVLKKTGN